MPLIINTNVSSLVAQRHLGNNTLKLNQTLERLASGFRINRAADDAAGLSISETLRSQIRGTSQAINNAQEGLNLLSVAEGGINVILEHVQRIREITVQAANDTNGTEQRNAIEEEIEQRIREITRIANATEYNGINLLSANFGPNAIPQFLRLQIGANTSSNDSINIGTSSGILGSMNATTLLLASMGTPPNLTSNAVARMYLDRVDVALRIIKTRLSRIGAVQNRLLGVIDNLMITRENYSASESRIRNADIARESSNFTKHQILQQAASSILAQANQAPSLALMLLSG